MSSAAWFVRAAGAVLVRPGLWWIALVMLIRLARPGWWRQPPFLPLPDPAYLRFRLQTMYGDPEHEPEAADLITYLEWCRAWPAATRS